MQREGTSIARKRPIRTGRGPASPARGERGGFTIVELLVVMVIMATLLALTLPAVTKVQGTARKTTCLNNMHNLAIACQQFDRTQGRLPASGYYFDPPSGSGGPHHSWAVSLLPWIEQGALYQQLDLEKLMRDPANAILKTSHVAAYVCPMDISRSKGDKPDLSYAVNGGVGFTIRTGSEVGDCVIDQYGVRLDLNGDGNACSGQPEDSEDRKLFKHLGAFFLENWKQGGTVRHHDLGDFADGTSQTFLVSENARTGYDPQGNEYGFAEPNPYRSAFYIGNPCPGGACTAGNVDYSRCNAGTDRINSGLWSAEGKSPVPNSFHEGGVQMAYADGHVAFLGENVDGAVYAALASPQGILLDDTPLRQSVVSGGVH